MEKILTISIAAYNVEKYLASVLDSLLDDEIVDKLEIFVVDDGGTDRTFEIAEEYARKHPQSVFPIHKENGGYGSTINTSIELATGKYFKVIDGDDWVETENLKELIKIMGTVTVDCVLSDFFRYNEKSKKYELINFYPNIKEGKYQLEQSGLDERLSMYSSAFSTKLLKNMPYRITEHSFYTDIEYSALPIPYIRTIYVFHKPIYVYRMGAEGQSMNAAGIEKHYKEHEAVFWRILKIYKTMSEAENVNQKIFWYLLVNKLVEHYRFLCTMPPNKNIKKEMITFTDKVRQECPELINAAAKGNNLVKGLIVSRFLAYPVLSTLMRRHWEKDGRLV